MKVSVPRHLIARLLAAVLSTILLCVCHQAFAQQPGRNASTVLSRVLHTGRAAPGVADGLPDIGGIVSIPGGLRPVDWRGFSFGELDGLNLLAPSEGPIGNGYQINMAYTGCKRDPGHNIGKIKFMGRPVPLSYAVTGGGSMCPGDPEPSVRLEGSQQGVDYALLRDGMPAGAPMAGTGSVLDFGAYGVSGEYTVEATDRSSGCRETMDGAAVVRVSGLWAADAGSDSRHFAENALVPLKGCTVHDPERHDPDGGSWTGPGASSVHFNPAEAGIGTHTLEYTFTDDAGCSLSDTRTVHVLEKPVLYLEGQAQLPAAHTARLYTQEGFEDYAWQRNGSLVEGSGHQLVVDRPGSYNVVVSHKGATIHTNSITLHRAIETSEEVNYVGETVILEEGITNVAAVSALNATQKAAAVQYFDALGRPVQTVQAQACPDMEDLVTPMAYDRFGRDSIAYLPYAEGTSSGNYRPSAIAEQGRFYQQAGNGVAVSDHPYAVKILEASPLGRLLEQGAPGTVWQPVAVDPDRAGGKTVKYRQRVNEAGAVRLLRIEDGLPVQHGYYAAGELLINTTIDEHDNPGQEYTDKQGKVVLKRRWHAEGNQWLQTRYIYDHYDNLRVVIQPEGMESLDAHYAGATASQKKQFLEQWAFQYRYDGRKRMTAKKVPGAGWTYMVYDNRDRLVLTRDSVQRGEGKWLFTRYDHLNRPVMTGWYESESDRETLQALVNNDIGEDGTYSWYESEGTLLGYDNKSFPPVASEEDLLTVRYYDDYVHLEDWGTDHACAVPEAVYQATVLDKPKGQLTGTMTRILEQQDWIRSASWYDKKYRVVQAVSGNHLGGTDRTFTRYGFTGNILQTRLEHRVPEQQTYTIEETLQYDHAGRLKTQYHQLGQSVQWTAVQGMEQTGKDKLKSSAASAGALAEATIPAGHNGWVRVRVPDQEGIFTIGLKEMELAEAGLEAQSASGQAGQGMDNVAPSQGVAADFGLQVGGGGGLTVAEKGSALPLGKSAQSGDVVAVARVGGKIQYMLNDTVVYTSFDHSAGYLQPVARISTAGLEVAGLYISTTGQVLLASNGYNAIGELTGKSLHSLDGGRSSSQHLDYAYNIRGWLTGVNHGGAQTANAVGYQPADYFAFSLYYDRLPAAMAGNPVSRPQHNGNISAMAWRVGLGLDEVSDRAYAYGYDAVSRLRKAKAWRKDQGQWTVNSAALKGAFDVYNIDYDANGNIEQLTRNDTEGEKLDALTYGYGAGGEKSNRLLKVEDAGKATLGFRDGADIDQEYHYDANGNMIKDFNKGISGIVYNHLNLPQNLDMGERGAMRYTYDAAGVKLRREVEEHGTVTTTDYSGPFVYRDGHLLFTQHPEGRIISHSTNPGITPRLADSTIPRFHSYQYHCKDHLGNVRLTFTTDPGSDSLSATMEEDRKEQEKEDFSPSYQQCTRINAALFNHTPGEESRYSLRLSGAEGEVAGLAKALPVFPGDTVEMEVYGKYTRPEGGSIDIGPLLAWSITGAFGLASTATGEMAQAYSSFNRLFAGGPIITSDIWESDKAPKAFINYILFDEDHRAYDHGFEQISEDALEDGSGIPHDKMALKVLVKKPGTIYIYLSNENPELVDVYFDDFTITHKHSPVIQEDGYYPFGLIAQGSRLKAHRGVENDYLYNGKELQEELGLDTYAYEFRMYDPALGRWWQLDPKVKENMSPYSWVTNNPVRYYDLLGLDSAQRANAVAKAHEYVKKNPGETYEKGKKGQPGENVDCSGVISACIKSGDEADPVKKGTGSGTKRIADNTETITEDDVVLGNVVMFSSHTGLIVDVKRDENGKITDMKMVDSGGTEGPRYSSLITGGKKDYWGKRIKGYRKWDTKPDKVNTTGASKSSTKSQPSRSTSGAPGWAKSSLIGAHIYFIFTGKDPGLQ